MSTQRCVVLIAMYETDSFAVRTLHAVLRRDGFDVHSIFLKQLNPNNTMDPIASEELDLLVALIRRLDPVLVGISLRSVLFQLAVRITERIRREQGCLVIWGGTHPTISPENCIRHADMLCIGEGEEALLELAESLTNGASFSRIRNLWIRQGESIVRNELRPLIRDMDSVPPADFLNHNKYLIDNNEIMELPPPSRRTFYLIMTSRGCPFSCSYCCNNVLRRVYKGCGPYVRRRSVENVINELIEAKQSFPNLSFVCFWDDLFTLDVKWIQKFQPLYRERIGLGFFCFCHPKATKDEIVSLLKASNDSVRMTMGIQSGSERIRREYFKRLDTNEEIVKASIILARHKVSCAYDVLMDNPLEGESDRKETLDLLLSLPRPYELHTHTLTHFPETDLTRLLLDRKLISEGDVEDVSTKSYTRWSPSLDLNRDRENLFWDNLYYLASSGWFPKRWIRWLTRRRLLRRYPWHLTRVLRLSSNYLQTVGYRSRFDIKRWMAVNRLRVALAKIRRRMQFLPRARFLIEGGKSNRRNDQ